MSPLYPRRLLLVCGIGSLLLFLGAILFHFSPTYLYSSSQWGYWPLWFTLAIVVTSFQLCLVGHLWMVERKYGSLSELVRKAERTQQLQKRIELLTVLREISLVIHQERDFNVVVSAVLQLADMLLAPLKVVIFLQQGEKLTPKVVHQKDQTQFDPTPQECSLLKKEEALAAQALHQMTSLVEHHGMVERVGLPLTADREVLGALVVEFLWPEQDTQPNLSLLAKYLALAIQKPTLYDQAVVDSLTSLYTKRHFLGQLEKLFGMSRRLKKSFSLVLLDIDHFKSINDTYGHLTGDMVLQRVGQTIRSSIREYDTAYRYGGEELAILLPETTLSEGIAIAERIRKKIETLPFSSERGESLQVTLSAGVATYHPKLSSYTQLIQEADQRLYQSKRNGRNQVTPKGVSSVPSPLLNSKVEA